jgi:hypothetical protein
VQRVLDSLNAPAYVANGRMDILATNRLGRALFTDAYRCGNSGFNLAGTCSSIPARGTSTSSGTPSPATQSPHCAPTPGATPTTGASTDLVGELSTRSEEFAGWWAHPHGEVPPHLHQEAHPLRRRRTRVTGEALELPGDPGLRIVTYTV